MCSGQRLGEEEKLNVRIEYQSNGHMPVILTSVDTVKQYSPSQTNPPENKYHQNPKLDPEK